MDLTLTLLIRAFFGALNLLPVALRIRFVSLLLRVFTAVAPEPRRVAERNLSLAFPDRDAAWRARILRESYDSLARTVVDFGRLRSLDKAWVEAHVEVPGLPALERVLGETQGRGLIVATGHLGSFELSAHCMALLGFPNAFVVRPFKMPRLDAWWNGIREHNGNVSISRRGAFNEIMSHLRNGTLTAILFDQNITRNHAVFVDWFGRPAATTKTVALAALRHGGPVVVFAMRYLGAERYRIETVLCAIEDIRADGSMSSEDKIAAITQRVSNEYVRLIRESPAEWFWMHRRWKTTPDGVEDFYAKKGRG